MGEIFKYKLKRLSMKAPNVVGNFWGSYPHTKLYGLMNKLFISNRSKHTDLRENRKRRNHSERERVPL